MRTNHYLGRRGEDLAIKYLRKNGYRILERNFEFRIGGIKKGEIDIVAKKARQFVFVEVKSSQSQDANFLPQERVGLSKRKNILAAAEFWLAKNQKSLDVNWQIDVISVLVNISEGRAQIIHFANAVGDFDKS